MYTMTQDLHPQDRAFLMSGLSDAEALSEGLIDYFDLPFEEDKTPEEIEEQRKADEERERLANEGSDESDDSPFEIDF